MLWYAHAPQSIYFFTLHPLQQKYRVIYWNMYVYNAQFLAVLLKTQEKVKPRKENW